MEHPEVFDSKFSFLFEPIKDLAENFNIDLNHHLDEYLNQLESDDVLPRNGSINFVEAALILRGSAAVYSKKVDYLYNLTLKILETLTGNQQIKKSRVEGELDNDDDDGASQMANVSTLDAIDLSKNLKCREEVDETSLSTTMPLSLQGQKVSNQKLEDEKMESEFDRMNFTINNCKIFKSTLILNYLEMKPLLLSMTGNVKDEEPRDIQILQDSHNCDRAEISDLAIVEVCPETDVAGDNLDVEIEKDQRDPFKIHKIEGEIKKLKAVKLLDPYENECDKFDTRAKTGKTFKLPHCLSRKEIKKHHSAIRSFVENSSEGYSRLGDWSSKGSSLEKELEDLLVKKNSMKGNRICAKASSEDLGTHGMGNDNDGYDVVYQCEDIGVVDNDVQDDLDYQTTEIPEDMRAMDSMESYEEAIKRHLSQFFKSANKYKITSELTQRVGEWESKMTKVLEDEGKMRLYDVHEYSTELIQQLEICGGLETPVEFSNVVVNKSHVDICRTFMSALHLLTLPHSPRDVSRLPESWFDTPPLEKAEMTSLHSPLKSAIYEWLKEAR